MRIDCIRSRSILVCEQNLLGSIWIYSKLLAHSRLLQFEPNRPGRKASQSRESAQPRSTLVNFLIGFARDQPGSLPLARFLTGGEYPTSGTRSALLAHEWCSPLELHLNPFNAGIRRGYSGGRLVTGPRGEKTGGKHGPAFLRYFPS